MVTEWGRDGAAAVAERKFYLHFTINLPTDRAAMGGGQRAGPPVIICHYKPPNKRGKSHNVPATGGMRFCTARMFLGVLMNILKTCQHFLLENCIYFMIFFYPKP